MTNKSGNIIVGLDIGSSKTTCVVAQSLSADEFKIEGVGQSGSVGVREGSVVEISALIDSIQIALKQAEKSAGVSVSQVVAGISGTHIRSENTEASVVTRHEEVQQRDVDEVIKNAQAVSPPPTMRYLAVIPQVYGVDNNWGIHSPVGLEGSRLDAKLHVVTAQASPCQNINKALRRCGLRLEGDRLSFNPLSSALAVTTPEEKRLGVLVIDMGSELTDVALFYDNSVVYSSVFPFGGRTITNEISIKTQLPDLESESVKCKMGQVMFNPKEDPNHQYELPALVRTHGHVPVLTSQALSTILDEQLYDMFERIYLEIKEKKLSRYINHGVVVTGGGANLSGIDRMAREVFGQHLAGRNLNARIGRPIIDYDTKIFYSPERFAAEGYPANIDRMSMPQYATVMGYLSEQNYRQWQETGGRRPGVIKSTLGWIKGLFLGNF